MPNLTPCPSSADLQRYLLGQIPEASASAIDAHLEQCAVCVQSLGGLPASDPLLEAMQASGRLRRPRNAVIENLVAKLEGLSRATASQAAVAETLASATAASVLATGGPDSVPLTGRPPDNPQDYLAAAQEPDEMGRLGGYRVLKMLGSGGMGVVFLAEDVQLKRRLALKVMRPSIAVSSGARQRFIQEAQATAAIEHEHIVAIFQVGEDRGVPFLAMPLLQGETLEERLRRETKLPAAEAVRIAREIAEGLAAAHDKGLIHRDIKPVNVWLTRPLTLPGAAAGLDDTPPRVKILDFGLARLLDGDMHLTQTGAIVGTPAYMAPEQARGEKLDGRSDLFSLGCVLYRMLTGERPFKGQTPMSQLRALELDTPLPPQEVNPQVPRPVSQLTMRLLAKNAAERPASAQAVVKWLRAIEGDLTGAAIPPAIPIAVPVQAGDEPPTVSMSQTALARLRNMDAWQRGLIAAAVLLIVTMGSLGSWWVISKLTKPRPAVALDDQNEEEAKKKKAPERLSLSQHFSKIVDDRPPQHSAGGHALRIGSLVTRPERIAGLDAWTLVTDRFGGSVMSIGFSGDGRTMVMGNQGVARHFDLVDYDVRPQADVPAAGAYHSLSPDGKRWARNAGQRVDLGVVGAKTKPKSLFDFFDGVTDLAWSPDSSQLVIATSKNLKMVDADKAAFIDKADWDVPFAEPLTRWSPKGNLLACASRGGSGLHLLDPDTGKVRKTFSISSIYDVIWSPTATHFAVDHFGSLEIWQVEPAKQIHVMENVSGRPAWDRNGRFLAFGQNKRVVLYDVDKDEDYVSFQAHERPISCVAFAPNNKTLITAGDDQTVRFWSAATWNQPQPELLGTIIFMNSGRVLAFSATGHFTGSPGVEQDIQYEYLKTGADEPNRDDYATFHKTFNWNNEPKKVGLFE